MAALAPAGPAAACGTCAFALTDMVLPPIGLWTILAVSAFLTFAVAATVHRADLGLQPRIAGALVILLGATFVSVFVGPFSLLPLALPPCFALLRAMRRDTDLPAHARRTMLILGGIHAMAAAVAAALLVTTLATRSDVDVIVKWGTSPVSRSRMRDLAAEGAAGLDRWREIMDRSNDVSVLGEAAEFVAGFGDADLDARRFERAVEIARSKPRRSERSEQAFREQLARLRARRTGAP